MKTTQKTPILFLICFLLLNSCKKDDNRMPVQLDSKTGLDIRVIKFFSDLRFDKSQIKKIGTDYLVEGDILFSEAEVLSRINLGKSDISKISQYGTGYYLGSHEDVILRIDSSMKDYLEEIGSAQDQWNISANSELTIMIHNPVLDPYFGPPNVVITAANLGDGVCGAAYFPKNGQPGSSIRINIDYLQQSGLSFEQRQRTITHEIGHVVGFRHTNWFAREIQSGTDSNGAPFTAVHINGTPTGFDPNSLMNGGECGSGATVLSDYDIIAAQAIYHP